MKISQAIEKAVDGGYSSRGSFTRVNEGGGIVIFSSGYFPLETILLDPLFWQSLGKAMGWKTYTWTSWKGWDEHWIEYPTDEESYNPPSENAFCQRHITHVMIWHRFIDHIAEGKTVESFFETLV